MYHQKYQSRHPDFVLTIYVYFCTQKAHTHQCAARGDRARVREKKRVRASLFFFRAFVSRRVRFSSLLSRRRSLFFQSSSSSRQNRITFSEEGEDTSTFPTSHRSISFERTRRSVGLIARFDWYAEYARNCTYLKQLRSSFRRSFRSSGKRTFAKENKYHKRARWHRRRRLYLAES